MVPPNMDSFATRNSVDELLEDMGFDLQANIPEWLQALAERLIDAGWTKE